MVFSTLHTNDASGAFTRLVDMGVEPYLVASTIEGVLAQRLIRLLCPKCKEAYVPKAAEIPGRFSGTDSETALPVRSAAGPAAIPVIPVVSGLYELLVTDTTVRRMCVDRASSGEILAIRLKTE